MNWLFMNLGTGDKAFNLRLLIQDHFLGYVLSHGQLDEYCVFATDPLKTDGDVIIYFPPALSTFARSIGATQECDLPDCRLIGIELAVDSEAAWQLYFPYNENE